MNYIGFRGDAISAICVILSSLSIRRETRIILYNSADSALLGCPLR